MLMASIVYLTRDKTYKEIYVFRKNHTELNDAIESIKRKIDAFNFTFVGSIIESIEEHFNKDSIAFSTGVIYH